jgi:hypothetical protein
MVISGGKNPDNLFGICLMRNQNRAGLSGHIMLAFNLFPMGNRYDYNSLA